MTNFSMISVRDDKRGISSSLGGAIHGFNDTFSLGSFLSGKQETLQGI
jgi:hypothetical protein